MKKSCFLLNHKGFFVVDSFWFMEELLLKGKELSDGMKGKLLYTNRERTKGFSAKLYLKHSFFGQTVDLEHFLI